ncbi:hypothetical protein HQ590_16695, partial [bacterium]|nr:hypothetical protein [bacterium]
MHHSAYPRLTVTVVSLLLFGSALRAGPLQILRNGGFEEDELTYRAEPASSCGGEQNDQWFNQQDKFPDVWIWPGQCAPGRGTTGSEWPRAEVTLDSAAPRTGVHALRLQGKTVRIEQNIPWNSIGDLYADLSRYNDHTKDFVVEPQLFPDVVLDGWFKCQDVPADGAATVTLDVGGLIQTNLAVARGTADWAAFEVRIPAAALNQKAAKGQPGKLVKVALAYASPSGTGQVWFDDLRVTVADRAEPNLLPDPSFEREADSVKAPAATGPGAALTAAPRLPEAVPYPAGWSKPLKWLYLPQPTYYIWNSWQHFFTPGRGHPRLDRLVSRTGQSSLRLELLPGDEYALDSPVITLNQPAVRPIEVTAWVRGDRVRHFDLILLDDQGRRVPANTTLTFWGGQTGGTYDWVALRKVFQGFGPLKSCRLRIAGRGFNAQARADIGVYHAYNQVST